MIVTQDPVNNSIMGLHLGRGMVSSVRMVRSVRMVSLVRMVNYHSCTNMTKGKLYGLRDSDHAILHSGLNVSSSAHNCGCVVNGGNAMAAI